MNRRTFTYRSSVGLCEIEYYDTTITALRLSTSGAEVEASTPFEWEVARQLSLYFEGRLSCFDLRVDYSSATPFQRLVYGALLAIPFGETRSYKEIATAIGKPKASRAVGMANNRNPIAIIIPCHRVVGADGSLTGYAGGVELKARLLGIEKRCATLDVTT